MATEPQRSTVDLLPHRPPFRLVDRLVSCGPADAVAERRITHDDPLVEGALPGTLLVEALAQTAALMATAELGEHLGYLVGLRRVTLTGRVVPGDTLRLHARRTGTLGALHRVEAEGRVGDVVVVRGELTLTIAPKE